ncbi:esterase-like activity of phytase family protein [Brevundimonas sp. 2R-24]|uniref:Esterase-like activity of phytase family protein n=1 Tax=Peiella sedimenti TaxID=3061083 RepID=A0ABT8SNM3_9CAUL|nr:esterase-like activity of phytase family protein [Caulobacteraceae bacterium XZ-24]
MRKYLGPVLAALLAACATTPEVGWQARHAANELAREAVRFAEQPLPNAWTPVETTTAPVALNAPIYEDGGAALVFAGGVEIRSDFNRFHGLSDIDFAADGRTFWSIVDEGLLVRGRVVLDAQGRLTGVEGIETRPLTDPDGQSLIPKYLADAEGMALTPDGELLVSFEREHRVWRYDPDDGRWLGERVIPDFAFPENDGMEGIAAARLQGAYWATGENGGWWLCRIEACETVMAPPAAAPGEDALRVTSLDANPVADTIFVLERAYHASRNTNTIRISQLHGADQSRANPWERLAEFTAPATVDNFEGIAAVRRPDGGVRLYILSDDNFNPGQRTLLMAFDVR